MKPWLKWTLIAAPILIGGIIVYKKLKKDDKPSIGGKKSDTDVNKTTPAIEIKTPPVPKPKESSGFPLKKGSKGAKVKELQIYLLRIDAKSLPKFGADGDFGSETESALKKIMGTTSVGTQAELDAIITKANTYTKGAPLVYQYNAPNVTPFLTIK